MNRHKHVQVCKHVYMVEQWWYLYMYTGAKHCVKSVHIRSFSGLYFPAFRVNAERYSVTLLIQSECGKMQTRKTLNTDTFHTVKY